MGTKLGAARWSVSFMARSWRISGPALVMAFVAWCAFGADGVLTNADIVRLTKAGVAESVIISIHAVDCRH